MNISKINNQLIERNNEKQLEKISNKFSKFKAKKKPKNKSTQINEKYFNKIEFLKEQLENLSDQENSFETLEMKLRDDDNT